MSKYKVNYNSEEDERSMSKIRKLDDQQAIFVNKTKKAIQKILIIEIAERCFKACNHKLGPDSKGGPDKKQKSCISYCSANYMEAFEIVSLVFGTTSRF